MHSLVVTRMSPFPATAGVPLRVAANIWALARLGPVDVITIGDAPTGEIPPHVAEVVNVDLEHRPGRIGEFLGKVGPRHPLASTFHSAAVEEAITRLGAGPGLIVLEEVWLAPYLRASRATGRSVVYDAHNVETQLRRTIADVASHNPIRALRREIITKQVRRLEKMMIDQSDQVWVCSDDDRRCLQSSFSSSTPMCVLPNSVDLTAVTAATATSLQAPPDLPDGRPRIVFLGDLSYRPNEDGALFLLHDVLPRLERALPDTQVLVVGRRPTPVVREAASEHDNVTVTGEVDDTLPYLLHGDLLAVTLRMGSGTRLKILEALAAGLPIVTTSKGVEGIGAAHREHLMIADGAEAITQAIVEIAHSRDRGQAMAKRGRDLLECEYSWSALARRVDEAVSRLPAEVTGRPSKDHDPSR